jgi:hypothetical protein
MSILKNNQLLEAIEAKIEQGLTPQTRNDYDKIVLAGMRLALQDGENSILAALRRSSDPIASCAKGAVNLVVLMSHQSQGKMPEKAMVPAAMTLMLNALRFADKAGIVAVGVPEVDRATRIFVDEIFRAFRITRPMLNAMANKVQKITDDPAAMERIKRSVGAVRDPGASTPTDLPSADGAPTE